MTKTIFNFFVIPDFKKEEKFLEEQALRGNHLISANGILYTFEKGDSKQVSYQIDYVNNDELDEKVAFYSDCGWENVSTWRVFKGQWVYLRKGYENGIKPELFTDNTSKLELFKRVRKLMAFISIFLFLPNMLNLSNILFSRNLNLGSLPYGMIIPYASLIFLFVYMWVRLQVEINKINKGQH